MILLSDGSVHLEANEVIPCRCRSCNLLYQPEPGSESSKCPKCSYVNVHDEQAWERQEERNND